MAGWHQGSSIRFCCINLVQCWSHSASSVKINFSCRLSVAGNQTVLVLASRQSFMLAASLYFCFMAGLPSVRHKCARALTPPLRWVVWQGDMKRRESNETRMLTHFRNAVPLVWGSLRLAPIIHHIVNSQTGRVQSTAAVFPHWIATAALCIYYEGVHGCND